MRLLTNPGSNLSSEVIARYHVAITPQKIVVDGEEHDTRDGVSFDAIDGWVRSAKEHPYVLGTSAAEFAVTFKSVTDADKKLVAVMSSKKIIQSYDAAVAAAGRLKETPGHEDVEITVVDSGSTDIGAALAVILAGEGIAAGLPAAKIAQVVDTYRRESRMVFTVETLDYLVKGGRATALRAFFANLLRVRPIIGFSDGELEAIGKMPASADPASHLADQLSASFGGERRKIWAAIFHGDALGKAKAVSEELAKRFDVAFVYVRALSPSIYLHTGRGSVGVAAVPLDALPWSPPVPSGI